MITNTVPVCCGVPMVRHMRPVYGTGTFAPVFRCPVCTFGFVGDGLALALVDRHEGRVA
ncbi:hypothetical protein [Nocardia macrotermitis]|uniref:Uncharacterized protein n=1 Tax=Nocardia macrotermitis TaxID=2585198 RepID=A0A7K0D0T2_9NOCA|nr:hypothetical protein [Nocardia macrotermitis]MQY19335.1 hypothetical protein [Nocardia macrotermitis]